MSNNDKRKSQAASVTGAYIFFAALYFVQSVGDPTSGLIAQPVRSLLRSWGSPAALGALMALLAPWTIKSPSASYQTSCRCSARDAATICFWPMVWRRRACFCWHSSRSRQEVAGYCSRFCRPTTVAIALGDVIVDALMVEKGQPLGLTGRFQSSSGPQQTRLCC